MILALTVLGLLACTPDPPSKAAFAAHLGADALVLITHQNNCPVLQQYVPTLATLPAEFPSVTFAVLNGSPQDSHDEVVANLAEFSLDWPVFMDPEQVLLEQYEIHSSAEALVLETADFGVVYRGAVDDQIGYDGRKDAPSNRFLATALAQHLAGEAVEPAKTRSFGCVITRTNQ